MINIFLLKKRHPFSLPPSSKELYIFSCPIGFWENGAILYNSSSSVTGNWDDHTAAFSFHLPHSAPRTTDTQWSLFSLKARTFGLGQKNWADKFWGIWGIFCQNISTRFLTVSLLSMLSIIQPLFLQKTKALYLHPKYLFVIGIWIWVAKN